MTSRHASLAYALGAVFVARAAMGVPPTASSSLNTCQIAVQTATAAFVKAKIRAVSTCLQAVSRQLVKNTAPDTSFAAATCATQFRKLNDSRGRGRQLSDQLAAVIVSSCAPGQPNVTHTLGDIIGTGAGVSQPLDAKNLNVWCNLYGVNESADPLQDWVTCITRAAECTVDAAIAAQYPRVLDWLALLRPYLAHPPLPAPPASDQNRISDAVAGLDALSAAIRGPDHDNVPSVRCGGIPSLTCGNGAIDGTEQCDGSDVGGETCARLGFTGGTLACTAACGFNLDGCTGTGQILSATGQTIPYMASDDGTVRAGAPLAFVDNGDGTITDLNSQLMWEKKSDDGGLHDWDNAYVWSGNADFPETIWDWLDQVNAEGGSGFAGKNDWRIPNIRELQSIVDFHTFSPAVSAAFNTSCAPGCSVLTCSCTHPNRYWSSSTVSTASQRAWFLIFDDGSVDFDFYYSSNKESSKYVRAVRGPL